MNRRYFQAVQEGARASIDIYGDITSWPWLESDVSSWTLAKWLGSLPDTVTDIEVRINSYGGEVSEGVAIFNALKAHPARVTTVCTGFAASIASVIFCAGDERVMNEASLLFVHNASSLASGNADAMRKAADDLDTVTGLSKRIYKGVSNLSEERIDELMDAETWIAPEEAIEYGLATAIELIGDGAGYSQDARRCAMEALTRGRTQIAIDEQQMGRLLCKVFNERYGAPGQQAEAEPEAEAGPGTEPGAGPETEPEAGEQQEPPAGGTAAQGGKLLRLLEMIATD